MASLYPESEMLRFIIFHSFLLKSLASLNALLLSLPLSLCEKRRGLSDAKEKSNIFSCYFFGLGSSPFYLTIELQFFFLSFKQR